MESVTGRRSVLTALVGGWGRAGRLGFAAGLAVLAALVAADAAVGGSTILVGAFVLAPFVTALLAGIGPTLPLTLLAIGAAGASGAWNENYGETDFKVTLAVVLLGSAFACFGAWNRERSRLRGERLRILDAVSEIADGSRPLNETLRRVSELIAPQVADFCIVDAVHSGRVTRAEVRVSNHPRALEIERHLRTRQPNVPRWLVEGDRTWRKIPRWRPRVREEDLRRMAESPEDFEFLRSLGVRSLVIVPLASRDRNLGALTLVSAWSRRRYTHDDVRFAQIIARRIGLALDNAGLFSDLESVERRMDTVMAILDEAVVIHDRDGELVFANPAAARSLGFETPEELLATPAERIRDRFVIRDEAGRAVGAEMLVGLRALTGEAPEPLILRVTDPETHVERWYRTNAQAIEGPDGPLYSVTVIEDVTDVKRAEFAQRLLARTGELLAASPDYRHTLDEVAHMVVPEFADWCAVNLRGDDGLVEQAAVSHWDPERLAAARELRDRYPQRLDTGDGIAEVFSTGEARLIEAVSDESLRAGAADDEHLRLLREVGVGSAILAPMQASGTVVGVLTLINEPGSRRFDAEDLGLAVELARRAGLAIDSARLATERARVASELQRELKPPSLPATPGWEVATMYRPAGEVNEVGGDFYEAFLVDDGWAVVLGDVSGRGAHAASLTAEARHTIRTAAMVSADPAAGLRLLDLSLRTRRDAALCSVALLLLPADEGEETHSRLWLAGHPPPLLLRGGAVEEVGEPGPMAGLGEGAGWPAQELTLREGEQLVLYTDGVIEARRPDGERFGIARLRRRLAGCPDPQTAVATVEAALDDFVPGEVEDDAAVVAVRRVPVEAMVGEGGSRVTHRRGRPTGSTDEGGIGEPVPGGAAG